MTNSNQVEAIVFILLYKHFLLIERIETKNSKNKKDGVDQASTEGHIRGQAKKAGPRKERIQASIRRTQAKAQRFLRLWNISTSAQRAANVPASKAPIRFKSEINDQKNIKNANIR